MQSRSLRVMSLVVVALLALAACGQKGGVHAKGGQGSLVGPGGEIVGPGGVEQDGTVTGPGGVTTGPGGVTTGPGGPTTPGGPAGPGAPVGPGDRTGITDKTITIGVHAPTTGAAPIPGTAFKLGKDLYWNWIKKKGNKVFNKDVIVEFANDDYKTTTAVAVCKDMAETRKAFLLIGGAGTDQIKACAADYAAPRGIPYLSPGVQEAGLNGLQNYFAVTMTYKAQMGLLMQLIKKEHTADNLDKYGGVSGGDGKVVIGHVRPNTPNFNDSDQALRAAVQAAGAPFEYKVYTVVKEGSTADSKSVPTQAKRDGVDILVPITAPTFTVQMAVNADSDNYRPRYMGVAISNNINAFLDTVCSRSGNNSGVNGAVFFAPWPGAKNVMAGQYDPDFAKAVKDPDIGIKPSELDFRKNGDLVLALWGIMKTLHKAFLAAGPNMTRQSFMQTMSQIQIKTTVFPDLAYAPGNPFGAQNVHVVEGKCDEQGDGGHMSRGPQYVDHPSYLGLRNRF